MASPNDMGKPALIRRDPMEGRDGLLKTLVRMLPAWIVSAAVHAAIILLFWLVIGDPRTLAEVPKDFAPVNAAIEEIPDEPDLENLEVGLDPNIDLAYDMKLEADISVPGEDLPDEAVGRENAPITEPVDVPPPPGALGGDTGAENFDNLANELLGAGGGYDIKNYVPGSFRGSRAGATKTRLLKEGGGNTESEAAVARGLDWLARHQNAAGYWSLSDFPKDHRQPKTLRPMNMTGKLTGTAETDNKVAGTAFGVLPFLAGGFTHKKGKWAKTVYAALNYLRSEQNQRTGEFGGGMYAHGLASIAMCEAFGLTSDPRWKDSAQKAINFIVYAQDPSSGGWRYRPRSGGDTSVVGWQLMAIKSGQMSGLVVPAATLKGAERWLDSVEKMDGSKGTGGFGYTSDRPTPTMSAVGLLCRQYLGAPPRSPSLINGTGKDGLIQKNPPSTMCRRNMYYVYYASQVMHHMGGNRWSFWNLGTNGKNGMRDTLVALQDKNPSSPGYGSWDPRGEAGHTVSKGGRIMKTSLCLLSLEVYYRHLPLYRRDANAGNKMMEKE